MKRFAPPLILVVLTLAAFSPLYYAGFTLWDDPSTVWQNPSVNALSLSGLSAAWTDTSDSIYMPVTRTAWILLGTIAGGPRDAMGATLRPEVFHAANVIVHLVATLLVYRLLRKLSLPATPALFGALVFALHPMQVESVAWVSGLKDVLAGALALAAINLYVDALLVRSPARGRELGREDFEPELPSTANSRSNATRMVCSLALFALAVLAKPTALVTPVILFAIAFVAFRRPWRNEFKRLISFTLVALVAAIIAAVAQPALVTPPVPVYLRPIVVGDAFAFYLSHLVWPAPLGIDYGRTPSVVMASPGSVINALAVFIVSLVGFCVVAAPRGSRLGLLGLLIFALALFPMLGWTRFDFQYYSTVADHYVYLAMIGPAIAVAAFLTRWPRRDFQTAATIVLIALCIRSNLQARTWLDTQSLARNAIAVNPQSAVSHHLLGSDLDFRAADLAAQHREDESLAAAKAALAEYEIALTLNPTHVRSLDDAATSCWQLHKRVEPAEALAFERRALEHWQALDALVPTMPIELRSNFGDLPIRLGKLALDLGQYREAGAYFDRALLIRPDDANAQAGKAVAGERLRTTAATAQSVRPSTTP